MEKEHTKAQTAQGGLIQETTTKRVNFNLFEDQIVDEMFDCFQKTLGKKAVFGKITTPEAREMLRRPVCPHCNGVVWEWEKSVSVGSMSDEQKELAKALAKKARMEVKNMTPEEAQKALDEINGE